MATEGSQDLGSRIVQAARLAVAMHLARTCSAVDSSGRTNITIGGADQGVLTDGQRSGLLMTGERPRRSAPSRRRSVQELWARMPCDSMRLACCPDHPPRLEVITPVAAVPAGRERFA